MFLYVIRHGRPDYTTDTLLPDGVKQAELVARRMKISGVDQIYASSMGRAIETAQPTAKALGLPIHVVDWARELQADCKTELPDGNLKLVSVLPKAYIADESYRRMTLEEGLQKIPCLCETSLPARYENISDGLDDLLRENGYSRNERGFYDVTEYSEKHIALFCHGGMGRVVVSHLMNIPYQYLGSMLSTHFTGVTVFYFDDGHRDLTIAPEYVAAHPEYADAYEIVNRMHKRKEETGCPETGPILVSYGDVGHLYSEGQRPEYYISHTGF